MESLDSPDQQTEVHHDILVVDLDAEGLAEIDIAAELGKKADNLLHLVDDLVVDRHLALAHVVQVLRDLLQASVQATERVELRRNAVRQALRREQRRARSRRR